MAIKFKHVNGTASALASSNKVYLIGQIAVETDTGQFKIGDGTTAYNTLAYAGVTGSAQTSPYKSFGDGSDGSVTISSGTTTLTRDQYYNNLTMSGTGKLVTNGYNVFVKGILDLTAAAVGAIQWNGNNGGNASGATGGSAPTAQPGGVVMDISPGIAGATATTGNGTSGGTPAAYNGNGGIGGASGSGGTGTSGGGGNASAARTPAVNIAVNRYETQFLQGTILIGGGAAGSGGASGAGDATNTGGGGGAGGNGGGIVSIFANLILKSASTPAGAIQANGGQGGNGGNTSAGVTGGGGGGGGGAGGWVYIAYNFLAGPVITGLIQTMGANGGNGGNGTGAGATGGNGGNSGGPGRISRYSVPAGQGRAIEPTNLIAINLQLVGTIPVGLTGGIGGFGSDGSGSL